SGGRRQSSRRRQYDRLERSGAGGARRLHPSLFERERAGARPHAAEERRLRSAHQLRSDRAGGAELEHPGRPSFGSGQIGAGARRLCQGQSRQVLPHLIGEWFKSAAAIDIVHVPYRGGGPSINDVVAGQVQMTFEGTSMLLPLIQSGKLRALATTSSKRIAELPDLPTMIESGFAGFVSTSWTGLLAPAHTPRGVIDKLNLQINEGLKSAELRSALGKLSNQPL